MCCHSLLQGGLPDLDILHCRQILYCPRTFLVFISDPNRNPHMCLGAHVLLLYHLRGMVFPMASPSHQEACTSLFSSSIRRQTEWKPQSQKTNKNDHMDHSLVYSMKLWAMLCRASQDGQDMVQSSDKTWSAGEGNGKPTQHACLENTMNRLKRQKKYDTETWAPWVGKCPISYCWRKEK